MMDNSKYLDVFIDESAEHLDTMYEQLLLLEKNPQEKTIIEEIFRAAHTIKGMSATMGYEDLASLTHHIENIFDGIRYDTISVNTPLIDCLFDSLDQLNLIVEDISKGGSGKKDVSAIVQQLERLEKGEVIEGGQEQSEQSTIEQSQNFQNFQLDEFQKTILEESLERGFNNFEIYVQLNESCLLKAARVYMVFEILEGHG